CAVLPRSRQSMGAPRQRDPSALLALLELATRSFGRARSLAIAQIKAPLPRPFVLLQLTTSALHSRHLNDFRNFYRCPRHLQMRLVLTEHLGRRLGRVGLYDRIAADVALGVFGSMRVHALGLSHRRSLVDKGGFVAVHPFHPRIHPLLSLLR